MSARVKTVHGHKIFLGRYDLPAGLVPPAAHASASAASGPVRAVATVCGPHLYVRVIVPPTTPNQENPPCP
jgi:hypothetical protein